jgi:hypothetical protein
MAPASPRKQGGDGRLLRLGLQAYSLRIAYEFDPYFGFSISRVDPLPHQLEAVYEYLLKLPRVRFLLADDAGAGICDSSNHMLLLTATPHKGDPQNFTLFLQLLDPDAYADRCIFRNVSRTDGGSRVRSSRSVFRTPPISRSTAMLRAADRVTALAAGPSPVVENECAGAPAVTRQPNPMTSLS